MKIIRTLILIAFVSFLSVVIATNPRLEERHDDKGGGSGGGSGSQKAPHNITQDICYNELTTDCD